MFATFNATAYLDTVATHLNDQALAKMLGDAQPDVSLSPTVQPDELIAPLTTKQMPTGDFLELGEILWKMLIGYSISCSATTENMKVVYVSSLYLHCYRESPVEFSDMCLSRALRLLLDAVRFGQVPTTLHPHVLGLMDYVVEGLRDQDDKMLLAPRSLLLLSMVTVAHQILREMSRQAAHAMVVENASDEWSPRHLAGSVSLDDIAAIKQYASDALSSAATLRIDGLVNNYERSGP